MKLCAFLRDLCVWRRGRRSHRNGESERAERYAKVEISLCLLSFWIIMKAIPILISIMFIFCELFSAIGTISGDPIVQNPLTPEEQEELLNATIIGNEMR